MTAYERLRERYETGPVPWDEELPPPEVIDFLSGQRPGRALDLGCGYGRASIYMARLGWEVDAVDFIEKALNVAVERARTAGVSVRFHLNSVTDLGFLSGPYDFALDVGCMHALTGEELLAYRAELQRLLPPGAYYLLFARLREPEAEAEEGPRGVEETALQTLLAEGFTLQWVQHGRTAVEDNVPWPSAWFLYRRSADR